MSNTRPTIPLAMPNRPLATKINFAQRARMRLLSSGKNTKHVKPMMRTQSRITCMFIMDDSSYPKLNFRERGKGSLCSGQFRQNSVYVETGQVASSESSIAFATQPLEECYPEIEQLRIIWRPLKRGVKLVPNSPETSRSFVLAH